MTIAVGEFQSRPPERSKVDIGDPCGRCRTPSSWSATSARPIELKGLLVEVGAADAEAPRSKVVKSRCGLAAVRCTRMIPAFFSASARRRTVPGGRHLGAGLLNTSGWLHSQFTRCTLTGAAMVPPCTSATLATKGGTLSHLGLMTSSMLASTPFKEAASCSDGPLDLGCGRNVAETAATSAPSRRITAAAGDREVAGWPLDCQRWPSGQAALFAAGGPPVAPRPHGLPDRLQSEPAATSPALALAEAS